MSDGHSGISNQQISQNQSEIFQVVYSLLKQGNGSGEYIIHVSSINTYGHGIQPLDFLKIIGLTQYRGKCPFFHEKCFYKVIASQERDYYGVENHEKGLILTNTVQTFANRLPELYKIINQEHDILGKIGISQAFRNVLGDSLLLEIRDSDIPLWVNEVKFPKLLALEQQKKDIQHQIDELSCFLPLLYGSGTLLEESVIEALQYLGLKAQHTPESFTADIFAETIDGKKKFGIEVTGVIGGIKKDSKKLTQVLEFERIKEHGEKTILLANTYNILPINNRNDQENFSTQVIDFLSPHPILLMTGWNLYCMIQKVMENPSLKEDMGNKLYTINGELKM